jgi:hypothetical protein
MPNSEVKNTAVLRSVTVNAFWQEDLQAPFQHSHRMASQHIYKIAEHPGQDSLLTPEYCVHVKDILGYSISIGEAIYINACF